MISSGGRRNPQTTLPEEEKDVCFDDDVKFDPGTLKPVVDLLVNNKSYWDISTLEIAHTSQSD